MFHVSNHDTLRRRRIQLFSGGLDSYILWHLLDKPEAVYVCYGHKYQHRELDTISALQKIEPELSVTVLDGPQVGSLERSDGHIPHRNLLLVTTAVATLDPEIVYIGALRGEASRDKSYRFLRRTTRLLSFGEQPVKVLSPSKRYTKTQLVKKFLKQFPNKVEQLAVTRSCYADSEIPCGRCVACFKRWVAMTNNDIEERYQVSPAFGVERSVTGLLPYMLRMPVSEWLAILQNTFDAIRAMHKSGVPYRVKRSSGDGA